MNSNCPHCNDSFDVPEFVFQDTDADHVWMFRCSQCATVMKLLKGKWRATWVSKVERTILEHAEKITGRIRQSQKARMN